MDQKALFHFLYNENSQRALAELQKVGMSLLEEEDFYNARLAFTKLDDKKKLKETARRALLTGNIYEAALCFETLQDRKGLFEALLKSEKEGYCENIALQYIGKDTEKLFANHFTSWSQKRNLGLRAHGIAPSLVSPAYELSERYDIGIGIAKGGLYFMHLCSLFGLKTIIADCHGHNKKRHIFSWKDMLEIEKGSRVLVIENDVVSGRTAQRVLDEILPFQAQQIDLALSINPKKGMFGIGTIVENIPKGYGRVYFPEQFSYAHLDKAVEKLEQVLKKEN